ncbi:MAG: hypothetical protein R3A79_02715 [Nannocystaceae bacterium]
MSQARTRGRITAALACAALLACLPDNPMVATTSESDTATGGGSETGSGGAGLFACERAECTFVVVSQTLDDRVDVWEVGDAPSLRGRVDLDLKPDPSGLQTAGNLLDEPYGLDLADGELRVLVGHYPDTVQGSLVTLPEALFAELEPGGTLAVSELFDGAQFIGGAKDLELSRQEAIFAVPHASGRMIVGVFANDLRALEWPNASQLLIVDPSLDGDAAIGAFDLGGLDVPCRGAWGMTAVDDRDAPQRVALACDGSDSVAIVDLPADLGAGTPAEVAASASGCGAKLLGTGWTTRFVAPDGSGGVLAIQSQLINGPRLWRVSGSCAGVPASAPVAEALAGVRVLNEVALVDSSGPTWLVAGGVPETGVYVVQGADPTLCGVVSGLDGAFNPAGGESNAPYALALADDGTHLAIGSGPPSNPESSAGRGQVHWVSLDTSGLASCAIAAAEVTELTAGHFAESDPKTWVRAPNVIEVVTRAGGGA